MVWREECTNEAHKAIEERHNRERKIQTVLYTMHSWNLAVCQLYTNQGQLRVVQNKIMLISSSDYCITISRSRAQPG